MTSSKDGRKSDGTFAAGNDYGTNPGGRPPEALSVRSQVKLRVAKDPKLMKKAISNMFEILADPKHPQFAKMLDTFVKLNGNYDPTEQKIDLTDNRNPFAGADPKKLEQLLNGRSHSTSDKSSTRKRPAKS